VQYASYTWDDGGSGGEQDPADSRAFGMEEAFYHGTFTISVTADLGACECMDQHELKVIKVEIVGHDEVETVCLRSQVSLCADVQPHYPGGVCEWEINGVLDQGSIGQQTLTWQFTEASSSVDDPSTIQLFYHISEEGIRCPAKRITGGELVDDTAEFLVLDAKIKVEVECSGGRCELGTNQPVCQGHRLWITAETTPSDLSGQACHWSLATLSGQTAPSTAWYVDTSSLRGGVYTIELTLYHDGHSCRFTRYLTIVEAWIAEPSPGWSAPVGTVFTARAHVYPPVVQPQWSADNQNLDFPFSQSGYVIPVQAVHDGDVELRLTAGPCEYDSPLVQAQPGQTRTAPGNVPRPTFTFDHVQRWAGKRRDSTQGPPRENTWGTRPPRLTTTLRNNLGPPSGVQDVPMERTVWVNPAWVAVERQRVTWGQTDETVQVAYVGEPLQFTASTTNPDTADLGNFNYELRWYHRRRGQATYTYSGVTGATWSPAANFFSAGEYDITAAIYSTVRQRVTLHRERQLLVGEIQLYAFTGAGTQVATGPLRVGMYQDISSLGKGFMQGTQGDIPDANEVRAITSRLSGCSFAVISPASFAPLPEFLAENHHSRDNNVYVRVDEVPAGSAQCGMALLTNSGVNVPTGAVVRRFAVVGNYRSPPGVGWAGGSTDVTAFLDFRSRKKSAGPRQAVDVIIPWNQYHAPPAGQLVYVRLVSIRGTYQGPHLYRPATVRTVPVLNYIAARDISITIYDQHAQQLDPIYDADYVVWEVFSATRPPARRGGFPRDVFIPVELPDAALTGGVKLDRAGISPFTGFEFQNLAQIQPYAQPTTNLGANAPNNPYRPRTSFVGWLFT